MRNPKWKAGFGGAPRGLPGGTPLRRLRRELGDAAGKIGKSRICGLPDRGYRLIFHGALGVFLKHAGRSSQRGTHHPPGPDDLRRGEAHLSGSSRKITLAQPPSCPRASRASSRATSGAPARSCGSVHASRAWATARVYAPTYSPAIPRSRRAGAILVERPHSTAVYRPIAAPIRNATTSLRSLV